eukprot:SAG31_NODE_1301_length_8904_cov_19.129926_2_plen_808_part_00
MFVTMLLRLVIAAVAAATADAVAGERATAAAAHQNDDAPPILPLPSMFSAPPLLSGIFMEAGCTTLGNSEWAAGRWGSELDAMQALGIDTIVTVCSADKHSTTYPTKLPGYRMSHAALPLLLAAADARNISVIVGLELPYPASGLPTRTGNATFDHNLALSSASLAREIYTLYQHQYRSLRGFYLPVEFDSGPNPAQWQNLLTISAQYLRPLTAAIKALRSTLLTVSSPGVASWKQYKDDFPPWQYGAWWDQALELAPGLDVVAAQDSVGVDYNAPTDVSAYMSVLRFVCERHGRQAWANVELFAGYGSSSAGKELRWTSDPNRVISQIRNEAPLVHKVIAFYWEGYLAPDPSIGPNGSSGANATWVASCKLLYTTLMEYRKVFIHSNGGFATGTPYYACSITKSGSCPIEQQGLRTSAKTDDELLDVSVALRSGPTHNISRLMLGCHLDLGYSLQERAFSSNMIFGESFEGNFDNFNNQDNQSFVPLLDLNTTWPLSLTEAAGTATLDGLPFHGMRSLRVVHGGSGAGIVGRVNRGVRNNGFLFEAGRVYEGFVYVAWRSSASWPGAMPVVQLRDYNRGEVIASAKLTMPALRADKLEFQRWNFTLTPNTSTTCTGSSLKKLWLCSGEIAVGLHAGTSDCDGRNTIVDIDYVVVQPGPWARLADQSGRPLPTLRRAAEALQSIGTSLVRIGGSFAESEWWFWKEWRGPPEQRQSVGSIWGSALISGWGPFEAIDMAMAVGFEPVLATFADSIRHTSCCSPEDMADLVEYCWGNESTHWGRLRGSDGHSEPYRLRYFELGCVNHACI